MANIKADEISKILREQIENYKQTVSVDEVGAVISVGDGIARVYGLEKVMAGEMLAFPHNVFGIALNLEEDQVGVVLLGESQELKEGDVVCFPRGEEGAHQITNDTGSPVRVLMLSSMIGPEVIEYLDTGKVYATGVGGEPIMFARPGPTAEYWEGEDPPAERGKGS